jgi:hypothetical protein
VRTVRESGSARVREWLGAIGSVLLLSTAAGAQVGTTPDKSPFLDLEHRHEISVFGGFFSAKKDPAKVSPQSGPMAGVMYQWRASGPVNLGMSFMSVASKRTELDPAEPLATRVVGTDNQMLYAADASLNISLTGGRSWHNLVPTVGGGLGMITNGKGADVGGFRFGTRFAFPWGAGVRWNPGGGSLHLRADVKDWMYTIRYPQAYYTSSVSGEPPILAGGTSASRWTNNFALTAGLSFTFK